MGILVEHTPPYQQAQLVERYVRTLMDRSRTILASMVCELPKKLRGELYRAAVTYVNMSPASKHHNATPMQLVEHRKPDLSKMHLVPFGTVVLLHETRNPALLKTHKLESKAPVGVVLGLTPQSHSTMNCLVIGTDKVIARNDFTVLRTVPLDFPWKIKKTVNPSGAMHLQRAAEYKARARHGRTSDGRLSRYSIPYMPPLADGERESTTSSAALGAGTEESLPREWTINRDRGSIVTDDQTEAPGYVDNPSDESSDDGEEVKESENVW
jgi:hypothetical protein